ncbi:MAG TPA: RNA polymerase sigma factor [Acidobacteriota bacterium]
MTGNQEADGLVRGLSHRDPDLVGQLVEQYQYRLFRYLLYLTRSSDKAEDIFQETWVRVLERGHQYDGKSKFESWLFAIARNLTIDYWRRNKLTVELEELGEATGVDAPVPFALQHALSASDFVWRGEESERIQTALGMLPAVQREILLLRFHEDFTLEEIAKLVAAPLSTVKSRLYRGLNHLRHLLEGAQA